MLFEELARTPTPMGDISVRRRFHPVLEVEVWEVILGDEHLMSNIFTEAEIALATLGLAALDGTGSIDVVVGGLGLGYTARAALADPRVASLHVVDALGPVIDWTRDQVLPLSAPLVTDDRCHLVHDDFFDLVAHDRPFGPEAPHQVDAVLVDIDHTPRHVLHPSHAAFYEQPGLGRLAARLRPGGVFALWSDVVPDDAFLDDVGAVFATTDVHEVTFPNPHTGETAANAVVVATVS